MAGRPRVSKKKVTLKKKKGPSSSDPVKKQKSMNEILGVEAIDFNLESAEEAEDEIADIAASEAPVRSETPDSEKILEQHLEVRSTLKDWVSVLKGASVPSNDTGKPKLILILNLDSEDQIGKSGEVVDCVQIEPEDIEDEILYWSTTIVCYVLGSNPPISVMEGFFRRIWRGKGVEKVGLLAPGVFMVRFNTLEEKDEIMNGGYHFFDKKPIIMKNWDPNTRFTREVVLNVPLWVQLCNLDLKFWGEKAMTKIMNSVGKYIRQDRATLAREKLQYARVLIEVNISQELPNVIKFRDENGEAVYVDLYFEWKPDRCASCKGFGHKQEVCKKKTHKMFLIKSGSQKSYQMLVQCQFSLQRKKDRKGGGGGADKVIDAEGFEKAKGKRVQIGSIPPVIVGNSFNLLKDEAHSLLEARVKATEMGALYLHMFQGWCFTTNLMNHPNGRIIVAWNPRSFDVSIQGSSSQWMHCIVEAKTGEKFELTSVYEFNVVKGRESLWSDLKKIKIEVKFPWLVLGDFNAILSTEDRLRYTGDGSDLFPFQNCVQYCGLEDVKFSGSFFTWNNKQEGKARVYAKIDRVLANDHWRELFEAAEVSFLLEGDFDHYFHQKVAQSREEEVHGNPMYRLVVKLKRLRAVLRLINKEGKGDVFVKETESFAELIKAQEKIREHPGDISFIHEEITARKKYVEAHEDMLQFLKQKVKIQWLKEGDQNTKLFHNSIRSRRIQNAIYSTWDLQGNRHDTQDGVSLAFQEYYSDLLGMKVASRKSVIASIVQEGQVISESQAEFLVKRFTEAEVKAAVYSIPNDKAPGLDGYSSAFFKHT
ncbi:uncharacterized protein LOC133784752 [Humulus lupulus]|uniref:uncharacterized protein LOC133784752 n=1 Tax=Humulus lupulus TaxID=3486 RepID=UPI002B408E07|nr:uncharacterized protein LOC133784752 [Humulus lupulus]